MRYGFYALGYYLLLFAGTLAVGCGLAAVGVANDSAAVLWVGALLLAYGLMQPVGYVLGVYVLPEGRVRRAARVSATLSLDGAPRVLDVGSGGGVLAVEFAKRTNSGRVTAADIWHRRSRRRLEGYDGTAPVFRHGCERIRRNAAREGVGVRIELVTADVTRLAFRDAAFDVVTCGYLLFHLHEGGLRRRDDRRLAALSEFRRVLRPGGRLVVFELVHTGWTNVLAWTPLGYAISALLSRRLTVEYWKGLLQRAGFAVESEETKRGNVVLVGRRPDGGAAA